MTYFSVNYHRSENQGVSQAANLLTSHPHCLGAGAGGAGKGGGL